MDYSHRDPKSFIGQPASELPTPALVLSKPVLEKNVQQLHQDVKLLGIDFRPHVKTLKSLEVTRMMLNGGKHRKIIASTLAEIEGALPLVQEGILEECLYGLPIRPGALPQLAALSKSIDIILMVDNDQQIDAVEDFVQKNRLSPRQWKVFIKIDVGTHRAGLVNSSPSLPALIEKVQASPTVSLYGFYCHAGHSYSCRTADSAASVLELEVKGVVAAASRIPRDHTVVVSVGSTPTAHVVQSLKAVLPDNMKLELHAGKSTDPHTYLYLYLYIYRCGILIILGNFPSNDLQQVTTTLVTVDQQALRVLAEVCSVYPERNEALINAGTIALSKETSDSPGYGRVTDRPKWSVMRMSQEHGILCLTGEGDSSKEKELVMDHFKIGQKVFLHCQHACITAAAHFVYYVVDKEDIVRETWIPWKGW
ncbi:hypothetical protein ASPZODRAFT_148099 [Penicilliopsis zonata CBS 506.65]|uniref:D-serine dehydratase n=1 Tax=Penicilliopsis zonata CBS 506.65 TaxID=1073090 RepID=A0A1L9SU74_9EURO|nr:hypothetical protein ASPZODRAFT_148099 [Penicilliopsis zonata CBS 506.65]OJJ50623.1 hypothetical protein ASPZODRAFT_148099 [Penicilliopsis zonata CBS 506.65]